MRKNRAAAVAIILVSVVLVVPTPVAAVDWRPGVLIARSEAGPIVTDAGYRGKLAAIAWRIASDDIGTLRLASNDEAGRGTFAKRTVARGVEAMAVSACGKAVLVAYRERLADGRRRLRLARVPAGGGAIARVTIRRSVPARGTLDVACGSRRATVAWTERAGSAWHAFVRHVRLDGSGRTRSKNLGVAHRDRVAVAASGDRAYVAWSDAAGLRLKRYRVGVAPDFRVAAGATRLMAPARAPMLAADGTRVALGFSDSGGDVWLHISRDRGVTFPTATGFGVVPGETSVLSLGLQGKRVVASLELTHPDHDALFHRISSRDLGQTPWSGTFVGGGRISPLDGFLVTRAGTKLAETFIRHGAGQDEQELVFRRQR